jgi:hypothetical protein
MLPSLEELQQQQQQHQAGSSSSEAEQPPAVKFPVWLALDEVMDPVSVDFAAAGTVNSAVWLSIVATNV